MKWLYIPMILILLVGCASQQSVYNPDDLDESSQKEYSKINKIIWKTASPGEYESGDFDIYLDSVDTDKIDMSAYDYKGAYSTIMVIIPNTAPSTDEKFNPFSDKEFRQAVNYLIDRQALIDEVLEGYGLPMQTSIIPVHPTYAAIKDTVDSFGYENNKEKGVQMLNDYMRDQSAEKVDGIWNKDGKEVRLITYYRESFKSDYPAFYNTLSYFSEELEEQGFVVEMNEVKEGEDSPVTSEDAANLGWYYYISGGLIYSMDNVDTVYTWTPWADDGWYEYNESSFEAIEDKYTPLDSFEKLNHMNSELAELYLDELPNYWIAAKMEASPYQKDIIGIIDDEWVGIRAFPNLRDAQKPGNDTLVVGTSYLFEDADPINPTIINGINIMSLYNTIHDPITWSTPELNREGYRWDFSVDTISELPVNTFIWDIESKEWIQADGDVMTKIVFDLSDYLQSSWHHGEKILMSDILYAFAATMDCNNEEYADKVYSRSWLNDFSGIKIDGTNLHVFFNSTSLNYEEVNSITQMMRWYSYPYELRAAGDRLVFDEGSYIWTFTGPGESEIPQLNFMLNTTQMQDVLRALDELEESDLISYATLGKNVYDLNLDTRKQAVHDWYDVRGHLIIRDGTFYLDSVNEAGDQLVLKRFDGIIRS